ncbi:type II toxin-antitoxin system mRNA interferase toxin, RelE/StbE family [Oenococcus kitaharae]|uniref:RelE family toxin-antitoxin system n=1 Tax=Oenococcus kitaharae DSM 17330 TaxID=1045004 RepID=G9WII7_9LACO|nr:type II toxin-antitoxin system mRNA interferase toxin, RelE/StbE family [Oenococcus kitaharae]EHN58999.1 RelE family toxin-antitoxin system [Oenococcus kitaharae DSM 17330]OEY81695.1 RelE family toxin-antitoxin system [Oenococcus kitaharae]OEY83926.1 RelE family toxin-antitoxin system [Oenococcus kitaharae]OEY85718.1 RelE family toxin-antitoxin system [Oenococcus kitaharae]
MYEIKIEDHFDKQMSSLNKLTPYGDKRNKEVREEILDSIDILEDQGSLPDSYRDHILTDRPWTGFHEYHILDDLLVVYYKVEKKKRIRMIAITNHDQLRTGKKQ